MGSQISPIDLIDSGADDDEPVKGVTHGHLRQWHDMIAEMHNLINRLNDDCNHWATDHTEQGERLKEEIKTVDRIWKALGIETFAAAGGLPIFEIVDRQKRALERVHHTLSVHGHVDAYTELHAFVQTALDPTASKLDRRCECGGGPVLGHAEGCGT